MQLNNYTDPIQTENIPIDDKVKAEIEAEKAQK